jgi:F0F1-type ATP synthase assembly protein I
MTDQKGLAMDAIEERRKLYSGFGETFSRAVEFVATPAIFGFLGHLIDGRTGTAPLFTLVLGVFAVVGMLLRFLLDYSRQMDAEEAKAPWRKS